jgi:hypothetical protein
MICKTRNEAIEIILAQEWPEGGLLVDITPAIKRRTDKQRKSLHLWLRMLSVALNDSGLEQKTVIEAMREGVELPWSDKTAKENLWRPIQLALTGEHSSNDIDTVEPSVICNTLSRWLSQTFAGFTPPPWPDRHGENN